MDEIKIVIQPAQLVFSPDVELDLERIRNPQDLNDALLSVRVEEATRRIAAEMQRSHEAAIRRAILGE